MFGAVSGDDGFEGAFYDATGELERFSQGGPLGFDERDSGFELTAEMPGLEEKNIEVSVANGVLTVKGHKEEDKVEKKQDFHLRERRFGSFARSVRVPETVDADKIEAAFKNGVLKVTLPKKLEARKPVKKIDVKGG